jgi:hypothetical protein
MSQFSVKHCTILFASPTICLPKFPAVDVIPVSWYFRKIRVNSDDNTFCDFSCIVILHTFICYHIVLTYRYVLTCAEIIFIRPGFRVSYTEKKAYCSWELTTWNLTDTHFKIVFIYRCCSCFRGLLSLNRSRPLVEPKGLLTYSQKLDTLCYIESD